MAIKTDREKAFDIWNRLSENGISDTSILHHIIGDVQSGESALEGMKECINEFCPEWNDEEDEMIDGVDGESDDLGTDIAIAMGSVICQPSL